MRLPATFESLFAVSAVYGGISLITGAPGAEAAKAAYCVAALPET